MGDSGTTLSAEALVADVLDLQRVAACSSHAGGPPPGLRRAAEALLGMSLDKTLQCSDWDARPLSEEHCDMQVRCGSACGHRCPAQGVTVSGEIVLIVILLSHCHCISSRGRVFELAQSSSSWQGWKRADIEGD